MLLPVCCLMQALVQDYFVDGLAVVRADLRWDIQALGESFQALRRGFSLSLLPCKLLRVPRGF